MRPTMPIITRKVMAAMAAPEPDYLRDPDAIKRASFAAIDREADLDGIAADMRPVAARLVHACAMPAILADLAYSESAATAGRRALEDGAPILADCEMVARGMTKPARIGTNPILCRLNDPDIAARAKAGGITRSAAAVERWAPDLDGAVIAIGNAPTALFRLLEILRDGAPKPAFIAAFPIGFIGAAEAKDALIADPMGVAYLTLRGRFGGSALAAAAINALALGPKNNAGDTGR